ncbi:predicted protein [Nematostella vectensis]|uniref:CCHC-type domain-containing protein n=1 Tax=Nematostella vectensis TaxID=45351 RepID=A7RV63_NEMVE|nr:predicted protein [Nematostella vectensis]|eukprot:XP_001636791.1 predicted protein [Nematostella vectensis]
MGALLAIIKALEDGANNSPDVGAIITKITNYGFIRIEDFDKYDAHRMAEQLAAAVRRHKDVKASGYHAIAAILREKLTASTKEFKSYFVALLADMEHSRILDVVRKVDKNIKKEDRELTHDYNRPQSRTSANIVCYTCGLRGHVYARCDPMGALLAIIKALEDGANNSPDVGAIITKITNYGFIRIEDFDKYDAHRMAEQLAAAVRRHKDVKASGYHAIAAILREKLTTSTKEFKSYFVALLADMEHSRILDVVRKVDKNIKKEDRELTHDYNRPQSRTSANIVCYTCGLRGHVYARCVRQRPYNLPRRSIGGRFYGKDL